MKERLRKTLGLYRLNATVAAFIFLRPLHVDCDILLYKRSTILTTDFKERSLSFMIRSATSLEVDIDYIMTPLDNITAVQI